MTGQQQTSVAQARWAKRGAALAALGGRGLGLLPAGRAELCSDWVGFPLTAPREDARHIRVALRLRASCPTTLIGNPTQPERTALCIGRDGSHKQDPFEPLYVEAAKPRRPSNTVNVYRCTYDAVRLRISTLARPLSRWEHNSLSTQTLILRRRMDAPAPATTDHTGLCGGGGGMFAPT